MNSNNKITYLEVKKLLEILRGYQDEGIEFINVEPLFEDNTLRLLPLKINTAPPDDIKHTKRIEDCDA